MHDDSKTWGESVLPSHLPVAQVAILLGISRQAVYDRIKRKVIPSNDVMGRPMVPTMSILQTAEMPTLLVAYSPADVLKTIQRASEMLGANKNSMAFRPTDVIGVYFSNHFTNQEQS